MRKSSIDNDNKPDSFSSLRKISTYLENEGWKVKKSTVSNHIKARLIQKNAKGYYDRETIDNYALLNLERLDGTPFTDDGKALSRLQLEKLRASTKIIKEQALYWENRNRNTELEIMMKIEIGIAARALIFKHHFETIFRAKSLEIIHLVSGDPVKASELTDHLLSILYTGLSHYIGNHEHTVNTGDYDDLMQKISASRGNLSVSPDSSHVKPRKTLKKATS